MQLNKALLLPERPHSLQIKIPSEAPSRFLLWRHSEHTLADADVCKWFKVSLKKVVFLS